jgi:hypothetical protein
MTSCKVDQVKFIGTASVRTHKHKVNVMAVRQSRWPLRLRHRSVATRLLGLRLQILPEAWMSVVSVVCCQVEVSASD